MARWFVGGCEEGACFQSRDHRERERERKLVSIIVALEESSFPIKRRSARRETSASTIRVRAPPHLHSETSWSRSFTTGNRPPDTRYSQPISFLLFFCFFFCFCFFCFRSDILYGLVSSCCGFPSILLASLFFFFFGFPSSELSLRKSFVLVCLPFVESLIELDVSYISSRKRGASNFYSTSRLSFDEIVFCANFSVSCNFSQCARSDIAYLFDGMSDGSSEAEERKKARENEKKKEKNVEGKK